MLLCCSSGGGTDVVSASPGQSPSSVNGYVDVGGYSLWINCRGSGSPTIVTEAGYDASGQSSFLGVMEPLSAVSRVCSYDRAGTGASDARPGGTITSADEADELHRLLQGAGVDGPYVLVAHSYGGFIARLLAAQYRDEVAGLVLLDSSHEDEIEPYKRHYGDSPKGDWVDGGNLIDIDATARLLRSKARDFGDLPLVAVQAHRYHDVLTTKLWNRTQADLATLSNDGVHVQAGSGGHIIMRDDPSLVLAVVRAVVQAARSGARLPACRALVTGTDGVCH